MNLGQSNQDLDTIPVVYESRDFWSQELSRPYHSRIEENANSESLTWKIGKVVIGIEFEFQYIVCNL